MAEVTHLPPKCSTDDIIEVLERDGAAIVDEEELQFLSPSEGHFLLFDLKRG